LITVDSHLPPAGFVDRPGAVAARNDPYGKLFRSR
jgi:hypothetical protein